MDDTTSSAHSEPSILNFLEPDVVGHLEVHGVESKFTWNGTIVEHVRSGHPSSVEDKFTKPTEQENLPQSGGGDLIDSLSSERILELGVWKMDKFLNDDSDECEHGNTTVLDLRLLQPLDVKELGKCQWVKTSVSSHVLGKVLRFGQKRHRG